MQVLIRPMQECDWPDVRRIYQEGIDTGHATFEAFAPVDWKEWRAGKVQGCSLTAIFGDTCLGWAALSPFSGRAVYRGVAEVSLYVSAAARRRGVGSVLMGELTGAAEARGLWTLLAKIFPENQASLALHLRHGFRQVGVLERLGRMEYGEFAGRWRDVVLLERRSQQTGTG